MNLMRPETIQETVLMALEASQWKVVPVEYEEKLSLVSETYASAATYKLPIPTALEESQYC
mgnify:CR=1 FL=1